MSAKVVLGRRTLDLQRHRDLVVACQPVENGRDLARYPGAHDDDVDTGQHRAVETGQNRKLDLGQEVESNGVVVSLLREEHFDEVGGDGVLDELLGIAQHVLPRHPGGASVGGVLDEIGRHDPRRDVLVGECGERAPRVPAVVAGAQATRHDRFRTRAGHDAELALQRDSPCQHPVGHAGAHTTLDDQRQSDSTPPAGTAGPGLPV